MLTNYKRPKKLKGFFSNDYLVKLWQRRTLIILGYGLPHERVCSTERFYFGSKESQTNDRGGCQSAKGHKASVGMLSKLERKRPKTKSNPDVFNVRFVRVFPDRKDYSLKT